MAKMRADHGDIFELWRSHCMRVPQNKVVFAHSTAQTVLENHKVQKEGGAQQEGPIGTIGRWWEVDR